MNRKIKDTAKNVCDLTGIAVRCYEGDNKTAFFAPESYPVGAKDSFDPFASHLQSLQEPLSCLTTPKRFNFGIIHFDDIYLVLGPVKRTPTSKSDLLEVARRIDPAQEHIPEIVDSLSSCPRMTSNGLLALIATVNKMINFSTRKEDILFNKDFPFMKVYFMDPYTEKKINKLESMENVFSQLIRNGDVESVEDWIALNPAVNLCVNLTEDSLRDSKNSMIIMTTIAAKAASEGGLDRMLTMEIKLNYISLLEDLSSVEEVYALQQKMVLEYTHLCRESKSLIIKSKLVNDAIRYIQHHSRDNILVKDIAESLSVSRGHLSSVFHEELGMPISEYIKNARVEEVQDLLKNSSLSLASISDTLGFSSQGYMTRVFKQVTGMTPNKYRNDSVSQQDPES